MIGYYSGRMAVELYQGAWILRARLPDDLPIDSNAEAKNAMRQWRARNRAYYTALKNG
ncbi:hypothetical protein ACM9XA_03445 [Xanthomonas sacchari]